MHIPNAHCTVTVLSTQMYTYFTIIPLLIGYALQYKCNFRFWNINFWSKFFRASYTFLYGGAVNLVIMNVTKHCFGRLRPHFMDVCRPLLYYDIKNCSSHRQYITDYKCTNREPNEIYLSFYSGHSMGIGNQLLITASN